MEFDIACNCGRRLTVGASNSGQEIPCSCGAMVKVPRLSELRQSVGQGAYSSGVVDEMRDGIRDGKLPLETECVSCNQPTEATVRFSVECERPFSSGMSETSFWLQLLGIGVFALICPIVWIVFLLRLLDRKRQQRTILGREVAVDVPMRCCEACAASRGLSNRNAKARLAASESYRELFKQYPQAIVRRID